MNEEEKDLYEEPETDEVEDEEDDPYDYAGDDEPCDGTGKKVGRFCLGMCTGAVLVYAVKKVGGKLRNAWHRHKEKKSVEVKPDDSIPVEAEEVKDEKSEKHRK